MFMPCFSPPHIIGHINLLSHICISPTCICWCLSACRWLLFKSHYFVIVEGSSVTHRQKLIDAAGSDSRKSESSSLLTSRSLLGSFLNFIPFFVQSSAESYAGYQVMVCLLIHFQKKINFCCFPAVGDFLGRGWGLGNSILFDPMC